MIVRYRGATHAPPFTALDADAPAGEQQAMVVTPLEGARDIEEVPELWDVGRVREVGVQARKRALPHWQQRRLEAADRLERNGNEGVTSGQ